MDDLIATSIETLVPEPDAPQIMDLTNNNLSLDGEEDAEPVDISMWTQQKAVVKTSQSPHDSREGTDPLTALLLRSASPHDRNPTWPASPSADAAKNHSFATDKTSGTSDASSPNDQLQRETAQTTSVDDMDKYWSPSPDQVDEVPFAAPNENADPGKLSLPGEVAETITIPIMSSDVTVRHSPQEVQFLEGPQELRELPPSLYAQLVTFCHDQKTDWPSCIRSKWPPPISLFRTYTGNRSWFENPQGGETLLAARYMYGSGTKKGQFVVVKQQPGCKSSFNHGRPAIILHSNTSTDQINKDNITLVHTSWQVWHPLPSAPPHLYARRTIEIDRAKPSVPKVPKTIFKTPSTIASQKKALESSSRIAKSEPVSQEDAATYSTRRHQKRPSLHNESEDEFNRPAKRARSSSQVINPSLLKTDYPKSGSLGARRDPATGEILLRRISDGKLIMLRCTECDYNKCESQQGLLNHLQTAHNIKYSGHRELQDAVAIEIDEVSGAYTVPSSSGGPKRKRPSLVALRSESPPEQQQSRRPVRRLATPPLSATPHDDWDDPDEPEFVFSKGVDDPNPRIRPLRTINSAEKLFVHALAAGVAKKDTLMFTVAVNSRKPVQIVRGDNEDFQMVVQMMRKPKVLKTVAVVTVEDLDL